MHHRRAEAVLLQRKNGEANTSFLTGKGNMVIIVHAITAGVPLVKVEKDSGYLIEQGLALRQVLVYTFERKPCSRCH